MKLFVVSDRSSVEIADRTEADHWIARFGASAGVWSEDSAGVFVAPDGQKVHASSLRQAHTQWRDANRGKSRGAAPGRAAAAPSTFDAAGAAEVYARRAKVFESANDTPAGMVSKAAGVSTLFHHAPAASDFAHRRKMFSDANQ